MASLWPWQERKALRATVRTEVAKKEFLHDALMMTCRETMLVAAKLGRTERALKRKCKTAYENERAAARTKSILGSRVKKLNAKLFAQRKESISLQKVVLDEQAARKLEAEKAAFAAEEVKSTKARIKRLEKDLAAEKLRVEKAEEACRVKDDAIKAAEQRQEESDSKLATALSNLEEATERIGELQQEHYLLQEKLCVAESTARDLLQKLKTAEEAIHTLQIKVGTLETQLDEKSEQLQAKFAAGLQDIEARMMKRFNDLEDKNSVTEQRRKDLVEQLATTQEAQANVAKDLKASRKTEKAALERVQRIEHEHQQQVNKIKAAEKAQRDKLAEKNAREQKKLQEDLTETREHNKVSKKQHKSDLEALQSDLTAAESQKQALEAELEKASGFEEKYSKAVADANSLEKELAAVTQEIQAQKNNCQTLSGLKDAAEERCAKLERRNEASQASSKQQQEANSNLVAAQKAKLSRETQHANKLQREVDGLRAEMQIKDNELREARVDKADLIEKFDDDAEAAAAKSRKLLQEEQSKNKIQQDRNESHTQDAELELLVCKRKLVLMTQNYDCLKEDSDAERDRGVRDYSDLVQMTKDVVEGFEEEFKQRCKGLNDLLASLATAESLEAEARGLDIDEPEAERSAEDSQCATSEQLTRQRGGRLQKARYTVKDIQKQLDYALGSKDRSRKAEDNVMFLRAQLDEAWGATRRTVRPIEPTEQQPERATASRPQGLPTTTPSQLQQQAHGQNVRQHQASEPAEFIQPYQQQAPAQSIQPTPPVATANSFPPGQTTGSWHQQPGQARQAPHQRVQGLGGSSQHQPGQHHQRPQQRSQGLRDSRWA